MLNWRRDPAREMRLKQLERDIEQLKNEVSVQGAGRPGAALHV
jgi:hypothetical protein